MDALAEWAASYKPTEAEIKEQEERDKRAAENQLRDQKRRAEAAKEETNKRAKDARAKAEAEAGLCRSHLRPRLLSILQREYESAQKSLRMLESPAQAGGAQKEGSARLSDVLRDAPVDAVTSTIIPRSDSEWRARLRTVLGAWLGRGGSVRCDELVYYHGGSHPDDEVTRIVTQATVDAGVGMGASCAGSQRGREH